DAVEDLFELLGGDRFGKEPHGAHRHPPLPFVKTGYEMYREMTGGGVVLEAPHDTPAIHAGQHHVEYDCARAVLVGKMKAACAVGSHNAAEPLFPDHDHQGPGVIKVVLYY